MKKVAMCIIVIAMIFLNVCLSPKLNSTNPSPFSLSLLQAMADGGAESTPPSDDDPIPNSLFPTDWSFSAIIDFFF